MKNEKYFIGVDAGTNSIGLAAANTDYELLRIKGKTAASVLAFEEAATCAERRGFRTARRRLDKRRRRLDLLSELFAPEISKIDPKFFVRIKESRLFPEDKSTETKNVYFNDKNYTDADFHKEYPTIHHLIYGLMTSDKPRDARMLYIACAWFMAHRGHFLSEINKENAKGIPFEPLYNDFIYSFESAPWECGVSDFEDILKKKIGITAKEKEFYELLFGGKKPKKSDSESFPCDIALIIKLLCGGKVKPSALFCNDDYSELSAISLGMNDEEFDNLLAELGDDAELIEKLKALYDWSLLKNILRGEDSISLAKIKIYERHKEDLRGLKDFVKKYCPNKYNRIFRDVEKSLHNYCAYSAHFDRLDKKQKQAAHKTNYEEFAKFLKKELSDVSQAAKDTDFYKDMLDRLALNDFLPKQVSGENRVIPYQLYWYELKQILDKASGRIPFLCEKDEDGVSVSEKILSILEFRVPYYVGPLSEKSAFAWFERKAEGKIYPWNFEKLVDLDKSEENFINRMTNACTYLPGEDVLPKNSLLYKKYEVLNEINPIRVNGAPLTPEQKQLVFSVFLENARPTLSKLKNIMISNGIMGKNDVISGIDISVKSNMKPYIDFKRLLDSGKLNEDQVEKIILHRTYTEDRRRFAKWLNENFTSLGEKDRRYISSLKYNDFGRLSAKFLRGINGTCRETGEVGTIIDFLWNTNDNLMMLLSDRYTFIDEIEKLRAEYYENNPRSLDDTLDDMYISNAVKRPIYRTLDMVGEYVRAIGYPPQKIFVEMPRGGKPEQKGKRTKSRREQILGLYKKIKTEDARELTNLIESYGDTADNRLQSDKLFLYFTQLGRCMYSGERIDIDKLKSKSYDIDHIYPQCRVKDDSLLNNKVLVLSQRNSDKGDKYPISPEWQSKRRGFWERLHSNGLITDEKFKRLTRTAPFSESEKTEFINRQLVETGQAAKALTTVLKQKYPESEIVYVKAGLVSSFRQEYDIVKSRGINDLHHAKDAYLNIVVGNVYNEYFTKKFYLKNDRYSLKTKTLFGMVLSNKDGVYWNGESDIAKVKKIAAKNNIMYSKFVLCRKGGLFDQQPIKAESGLVELKKGLDTAKYGGYRGTTASFFSPVKYTSGKTTDIIIMPVELMIADKFISDAEFAQRYALETIEKIRNKKPDTAEFLLGKRMLKINTVFSLDGFRAALTGKASGGKQVGISPQVPLIVSSEDEKYIKRLERFIEKSGKNENIKLNSAYDEITAEKNEALYDLFASKLGKKPFSLMPNSQSSLLLSGKDKFRELALKDQVTALVNILYLFKTGRSGSADLTLIGGSKNSGVLLLSSCLSNWKKTYSDVRIIDVSPAGLYEKRSQNLLDLL